MQILFIQTGGTIDKDYAKGLRTINFHITEPAIHQIMDDAHPSFDYHVVSLLKKDSTDLTDSDRQLVRETCLNYDEQYVVITHGTDTMSRTAEDLEGIKGKVIIITGAARPHKFRDSDAGFNVGCAVGSLPHLKPGVYIAMNGRVEPWEQLEKAFNGQFITRDIAS